MSSVRAFGVRAFGAFGAVRAEAEQTVKGLVALFDA